MADKKQLRVGIYARVSREEQILENQLIVLRDEVARHDDWVIYDEYTDKCSGANQNRPGLDRILKDAEQHKIDFILATKLDRMARSTVNLSNMCAKLDKLGVGLKFVEQNIDFTSPEGRLIRTVLGAIAEFELELIHSRTKDGQERARREGKVIGRPKNTVSQYQIDKAKQILAANPDISQREFAAQFIGIGRRQLIEGLRAAGVWTK